MVYRDYRGDGAKGMVEIFFKLVRSWKDSKGTYPPPFIDGGEGLHFLYIRRNGLYFVGATKFNVPPAFGLELLSRIAGVCKDYCGLLNEESIRLNFVLVYELLDEVLDFGYPQGTSTEVLKSYISNQPCNVTFDKPLLRQPGKTLPSHAANKPIATSVESMRTQKNEIFVDLLERLTILVAPTGNVLRSHLDGCIQMRSFLGGQPGLATFSVYLSKLLCILPLRHHTLKPSKLPCLHSYLFTYQLFCFHNIPAWENVCLQTECDESNACLSTELGVTMLRCSVGVMKWMVT
jgi:AP-4 complex subunit mu-1